jgi:uncharacterized membrane protein YfcA
MLLVMTFFMEAKTLVIYSLLPQILTAVIGLARSPRTVNLRFLSGMLIFAALGSAAGLVLFYSFSTDMFEMVLAALITLFGVYLILPIRLIKLNKVSGSAMDLFAGMSQALIGISGPVAMTRLMATFDDKTIIRNYALAFYLSVNLFRATGYISQGTISDDIVHMMLISAPFLIIALWFANDLHFRVNELLFRRVVSWIIFLGGILLLINFTR